MEKCVPANFTRSRQARLLAVVPVRRREGEGREGGRSETKEDGEAEESKEIGRRKRERETSGRRSERRKRTERRQEEAFCNCAKGAHTQATEGEPGDGGVDTGGGFKCVTKEVNL